MARPRSTRVAEIKAKLVARIRDGFHRPGDPFVSNRALAERDGISYQTAHRLLDELVGEGWLERRSSCGTFIAGRAERLEGVQLLFSRRAQAPGSFGAGLLQRLVRSLREARVPFVQSLVDTEARFRARHLPVIWECPELLERLAAERRFCVLLQDSPPPGVGASYVDCVRTDDFSGGVCAAQVLLERLGGPKRLVVVTGPEGDRRSAQRVAGFQELVPGARLVRSGGWFVEHGRAAAAEVLQEPAAGVFCCNDRIAQGLLAEFEARGIKPVPSVAGFDNAPIAEALHLTTIAIPWEQFAQETLALVKNRLGGDTSPARQIILSLRPHKRLTA